MLPETAVPHGTDVIMLPVGDVIYREDLYPRSLTDPTRVQEYADNLEMLPPIEVNQHHILIDGWHRWTAHKKAELPSIPAVLTETTSEEQVLELAVARNAIHGLQLSREDKERYARRIYNQTIPRERPAKRHWLHTILSVTESTLHKWVSHIDHDMRVANRKKAFDLWLSCHTQQEIAEQVDVARPTISGWIDDFVDLSKMSKSDISAASHANGFETPIYNIWKQRVKTTGTNHFGNTERQWLDNLLYLHTQPFDIVVDPFAGGGDTINVCQKRYRRFYVSDRKPIIEREKEIRKHDLVGAGPEFPIVLPALPHWHDVKLVYLESAVLETSRACL